jgi:hypothetical protein
VINPPYGFAPEMREVVADLARILAKGAGASGSVGVLAER